MYGVLCFLRKQWDILWLITDQICRAVVSIHSTAVPQHRSTAAPQHHSTAVPRCHSTTTPSPHCYRNPHDPALTLNLEYLPRYEEWRCLGWGLRPPLRFHQFRGPRRRIPTERSYITSPEPVVSWLRWP